MSCAEPTRFVILGRHVGWPVASADATLDSLGPDDDLRLAGVDTGIDASKLNRFIPPVRLARGCGPCAWYLVVPGSPVRILRRELCQGHEWIDILPRLEGGDQVKHPVAIAFGGSRIAVLDIGVRAVFIWSVPDGRLAARIPTDATGPIAFGWCGELFVARDRRLDRYTPAGDPLTPHVLGGDDPIARMIARDDALWIVTKSESGTFNLRQLHETDRESMEEADESDEERHLADFAHCGCARHFIDEPASEREMQSALQSTGIVVASDKGFCLEERTPDETRTICFRWNGRCATRDEVTGAGVVEEPREGILLMTPIDSGIQRCQWHRIRVDADIPIGTVVTVEMATSESATDPVHPDDWTAAIDSATDFLIRQPAGRYLTLRIRLQGTDRRTPVVRRLRIDFPRATSLDSLPDVYREDPRAEDFTERFLSLFDGTIEDMDRAIERFAVLLDPALAPAEVLPWLGSFFGVIFDPGWDEDRRRRILAALPDLYRRRGTPRGLSDAIELVFDARPAVTEYFTERASSILGHNSHLRTARLFGRSSARFRLGRSSLGQTPLRSYGDPDLDPFQSAAHQFSLLLPSTDEVRRVGIDAVDRLVASQKPAHTVHSLRTGRQGFIVGVQAAVGVETLLTAPEAPVLAGSEPGSEQTAAGTARLRRTSILRAKHGGLACHTRVGISSVVGVRTFME